MTWRRPMPRKGDNAHGSISDVYWAEEDRGKSSSFSSLRSDRGEMDLSRQTEDGGAIAAAIRRSFESLLDIAVVSPLATTTAAVAAVAAVWMALLLETLPLLDTN